MVEVIFCTDKEIPKEDRRGTLISEISDAMEKLQRVRQDLEQGYDGFMSTNVMRFEVEEHKNESSHST